MQIGIDLGATKVEYVLLDNNNKEFERSRTETPKNFPETIELITKIVENLENKYKFSKCFWVIFLIFSSDSNSFETPPPKTIASGSITLIKTDKLSLNEWKGQKNVEFIIDDISVNKTINNSVPSSNG